MKLRKKYKAHSAEHGNLQAKLPKTALRTVNSILQSDQILNYRAKLMTFLYMSSNKRNKGIEK